MFVISVKGKKLKYYLTALIIGLFVTIGAIVSVSQNMAAPVASIGPINLRAATAEERIAFFSQFGHTVKQDPVQVKEIIIPYEFDETYEEYNKLQKSQGLDLEKYKGKRVKLWSYEITNYPGYEGTDGVIRGNILVYDTVVIAGDVSSVELDGFMTGFEKVPESIR